MDTLGFEPTASRMRSAQREGENADAPGSFLLLSLPLSLLVTTSSSIRRPFHDISSLL